MTNRMKAKIFPGYVLQWMLNEENLCDYEWQSLQMNVYCMCTSLKSVNQCSVTRLNVSHQEGR